MIQAKPVYMFRRLSVCPYVMLVCLYALITAVDVIIDSRSYVLYITPYF